MLIEPYATSMSDYRSIFAPGLMQGQVALVTGGGSGIGRCTAHELKSLGARIALVGRTWEMLEQVKQELDDPDTFIFAADLREEDQVKAAVDGVLKWSGRIDGLINNAGGQFPAPLKDISLNGWNAVIRNNMTATFLMSKEVYLRSMEQHGGAIVNVGADFELGMPGMGHNGAAPRRPDQLHLHGLRRMGSFGRAGELGDPGLHRLVGPRPLSGARARRAA